MGSLTVPEVAPEVEAPPADYAELVDRYFDFVRGICRKMGVREDRDAAQTILLRFIERDFLNEYDPEYRAVYDGKARRPRFSTFLGAFTARYCLHIRERESTQSRRETLMGEYVGVTVAGGGDTVWSDGVTEIDLAEFEELEVVAAIKARLEEVPVRGRRDLGALFEAIVEQVRATGVIDRRALQRRFGLGSTTIGSMIQDLRSEVRIALA